MVLILSIQDDPSTDHVIAWLNKWEQDWKRIGPNDDITVDKFEIKEDGSTSFVIEVGHDFVIRSEEIKAYWYRRGHFDFSYEKKLSTSVAPTLQWSKHIEREFSTIGNALHSFLKEVPHINAFEDNTINKIHSLLIAGKKGLLVPKTMVTDNRVELQTFIEKCDGIITKGIHGGLSFTTDGETYEGFTRILDKFEFEALTPFFLPTLFQEKLHKKYEVRSFYLEGRFFSMAIFSQTNAKTMVDFRNYDSAKPNRTVPYKLPALIEHQLTELMAELGMNSGSFDLVRTTKGKYYFLEVNPIGQFGQVSIPCNYAIEMHVAEYLYRNAS